MSADLRFQCRRNLANRSEDVNKMTRFRFAGIGSLLVLALAVGAVTVSAQATCDDYETYAELDGKVRENFGNDKTVKVAIDAGKELLEKFGTCADYKDFADWVKAQMPKWEARYAEWVEWEWRRPRIEKFDGGIQKKRYDDVYSAGKELVERYPDNVHYLLPLGLIGLYETYNNNFKYNDDTIRFAKMAIEKFKAGKGEPKMHNGKPVVDEDGSNLYGAFQFERTREEAISEMTYGLAHIYYYAKKDPQTALRYYYEAAQLPGPYSKQPRLYTTVGAYYLEQASPIGRQIASLIEKQKAKVAEAQKATEAADIERFEAELEALDAEIKGKIALFNGYTERALDAFGRAYKVADDKVASEKQLKAEVYKQLQDLYQRRFPDGAKMGLDSYISSMVSEPMPNPTSEVTPVYDTETTSTATSGSTAVNRP